MAWSNAFCAAVDMEKNVPIRAQQQTKKMLHVDCSENLRRMDDSARESPTNKVDAVTRVSPSIVMHLS